MIPRLPHNFREQSSHKVCLEILAQFSCFLSLGNFFFLFAEAEHAPPSELDPSEAMFTVSEMALKFSLDGHVSGKVAAV